MESREMLSGGLHADRAVRVYPIRFHVDLAPLNGSGVTGTVTGVGRTTASVAGNDSGRLRVRVSGLEAGQAHGVEIDGMNYLYPLGVVPPPSAATLDPSPAGLGDSIISDGEAEHFAGTPDATVKPILASSRVGPRTVITTFRGYYDQRRGYGEVLILTGMTVNGRYEPTVPVAAGLIQDLIG